MEEISHRDHDEPTNKEPVSCSLPLPRPHSTLPSPVSAPSDQAYLQASAIFQQLREEKPVTLQPLPYGKKMEAPLPGSGDKATQRQAYQLAFSTLKYQDLLEDIISDSCFLTSQHISADLLPLAMVMLFDLQDRRFLLRELSTGEREKPMQEVRDLESSLHRCKTRLAASLARCRVKQNLQSVSCFLSDLVRTKQHRAKHLPLYAWVNTLKASVEEVCEALQSAGLCEVRNMTDLKDSTFCRDSLCPDTLVFCQQLQARLQRSSLATTHVLNIQDRSVCVAVTVLRPLLFNNGDVLVVGSFSAVTVAHIAVVAAARSGQVLVCGADHTSLQVEEIRELLTEMDIKNVRVLSEAFCSLNEWDATIQRLKVIILHPRCSSSALSDPVPTIHSEHGDWDLLPDLSHGSVSQRKITTMSNQQARLLAHALTFPKVQTVVYCTRSVYPEENEHLVKRVLEKTHTHPKLLPFRVNGPVFPVDSQSGDATNSKFFRLEPSQFTNGCFIARLSRQADPTKVETVQDVLARAAAKGLLGGIIPEQSKTGKKGKSRKTRGASATSKPPSPSSQERQTGREHVNGQGPDTPSGHEEEKGGRDVKGSKEEEEYKTKEDEGGEKEKKRTGFRGLKRKLKRRQQTNSAPAVSKHHPKTHKKKPTKRKVNHSRPKRHLTKTIAHKLSDNPMVRSQQTVFSTPLPAGKHPSPARPAPPTPPAASKQAQRQKTQPQRAEKTLKDASEPASLFRARGAVVRPGEALTTAVSVLPPISSPSSCSLRSGSGSSPSHPLSQTSHCQRANMSASSSSVCLPGLQRCGD
ncbi:putative methyltransferase NSUN7 [Xiphias gladius]|uniref:putative methyltransferase NSUN7 n=1 Tax=Xiphias gladius TaxID=8245 RepID=UPI001A988156|nr:putative methyltransferase NSUN7 [Xiphias gladius]